MPVAHGENGTSRVPNIPPLAGLATYERAAVPGYSVDKNVMLLRRYNWVERKMYDLMAARLNSTPEWEVKCAFSLHMYLDAEHATAIGGRVAELRKPPHHLDVSPDDALDLLLVEALHSAGTVEVLTALYRVLRPALLAAYEAHLQATNPLFEQPTVRLLRLAISEEREAIEWGESAIAAMIDADPAAAAVATSWAGHLNAYLEAAGGITGAAPLSHGAAMPLRRSTPGPVPVDIDPKRDARCKEIYNFNYRPGEVFNDAGASFDERNLALMYKRYHEMDVPEAMAAIIAQTPGKPWQYYRDMARQLWDEARHAMMGEVWFVKNGIDYTQFPNHVGWSSHLNLDCNPTERHLILYHIEQRLMHGQTGKKYEWEIAQKAGDDLSVYFQDYDWADEVLHAQIGRKWLKPAEDDPEPLLDKARRADQVPATIVKQRALLTPQRDWWPDFVQLALGKPSTAALSKPNAVEVVGTG